MTFLINWLRKLVTHLQFATIFPLAIAIIICYPFFLSLREDPRPCILLHQAYPRPGATLANMRQAIIVPPVFVNALDPKITPIIEPLKQLHDDIAALGSNTSTRLYSMFDDENTAPISQFVAPTSSNVQGLLFTFVYEHEDEGAKWDDVLALIAKKAVEVPPANVVDRQELEEAEISTASSAHYSLWPGASGLSQLIIGVFAAFFLWYTVLWIHSTSLYRPWLMVLTIGCRVAVAVFSALSVVSFLYPTFNTLVLSRFLWIIIMATYVGLSNSTQVLEAAEHQQQSTSSQSALHKLVHAFKHSEKSVFEVMSVQLSLALLSVFGMYITKQPTLLPLTAFMITFLTLDTALHYTFFAATLYIDMVGLELHDFVCVERPFSRRKTALRKVCDSNFSCLIQAIAYNFDLVVYLPIITYLVLHCNGGYFLNKIHPHIKHALSHPKYIDSFVNPLDEGLRSYAYLKIYRPVVFSIGGHFGTPSTKVDFTVSTLRYGNVISMMLEMFCLLIFFSSVCMIGLILLTDQQKLSLAMKGSSKSDSEVFAEVTIDVNSKIDVVKATTDEQFVCVLSLDGQISIADVSALSNDSRKLFVIPTTQNSWSVQSLLLNSRESLVGAIYRTHVDVWNVVTGQKYYEVDFSQVVDAPHLVSASIKSTLLIIASAGRLVELHTNKPPEVYSLSRKPLRWAIVHLGSNLQKAVLCDVDNQLYLCKRLVVGGKVFWKSRPLQLSKAFLVDHGSTSVEPSSTVPYFRGMLPLPVPWTEKYECNDDIINAISVPDLQLWIAFTATKAMFVDLQSGIIVKIVPFNNCKPGSAKVFHSQPTHCAFCGCIAISSFTIAYEALNSPEKLICETWQIPNKSRNSICLRTERDPHETRCRGFMATEATIVSIDRVKTWAPTKINMVMGIRERLVTKRTLLNTGSSTINAPEWEAFAISAATGVTSSFKLNEAALDTQLMTSLPGQAVPLGPKSVCVPFGNVVKVLYLQQ